MGAFGLTASRAKRTELFHGTKDVIEKEVLFFSRTKLRIDTCMNYSRPPLAIGIGQIKNAFLDAKIRGVRLRYLTEITNHNLSSCKEIMKIVDELRHLDGIKGNFMISEREYLAPTTSHEKAQPAPIIIFSNIKQLVEHQQYVFDSFWNRAIPAKLRIREIEEGAERTNIEVIPNSDRARKIYLNLVNTAENEIMLMFPTTNAFIRQEKIGAIEFNSIKEQNIKVRILMPAHKSTEQIVQNLREQQNNIDVRYIEETSGTQATFLAIDRKASLVMEIRDDSKTTFDEAIGLSTYSNSKAGVLSYIAIFENLWKQTELYEDIKKGHEQLKIHDKMQKEFINIAAHELRTPIQPILGLSDLLNSKTGNIEQYKESLDTISRNAKRLSRLTDDILDATRIESKSLLLKKERFNAALNEAKARFDLYNRGLTRIPELIAVGERLFGAEVDLYDNPEEKAQVLQRQLDVYTEAQLNLEKQVREGLATQADLERLRYNKLSVEIDLFKARNAHDEHDSAAQPTPK